MFGRHSSTATHPNDTTVDERGERYVSSPDGEQTEVLRGRPYDTSNATGTAEPVATEGTTTEPVAERPIEPASADERGGKWAHVSGMATLSLVLGTLAIAATLTGLLAPLGFAAGVLAVLIGLVGFAAVRRPAVTGHTLVMLGVLFGLIAIVLSVLAMSDSVSWLSSKTDEVATVHTWLNDHMHWLRRW